MEKKCSRYLSKTMDETIVDYKNFDQTWKSYFLKKKKDVTFNVETKVSPIKPQVFKFSDSIENRLKRDIFNGYYLNSKVDTDDGHLISEACRQTSTPLPITPTNQNIRQDNIRYYNNKCTNTTFEENSDSEIYEDDSDANIKMIKIKKKEARNTT